MKYGQLMFGLLTGCALGVLVAANNPASAGGSANREEIEQIVRDVIAKEPKLIMESVQNFQMEQQKNAMKGAGDALKDDALRDQVFNDGASAFIGPKDAKKVVVKYFDYNCPACKAMLEPVEQLRKKHKDVKVIFKEFPIFGPTSDANSKIGLAVWNQYPDKYFDFFDKMMSAPRSNDGDKQTLKIAADLGMDVKKLKTFADSKEAEAVLAANRAQGEKLMIRGTPTVIIGDEVIGHAVSYEDMIAKLNVADKGGDDAAKDSDKPADKKPAAEEKKEEKKSEE